MARLICINPAGLPRLARIPLGTGSLQLILASGSSAEKLSDVPVKYWKLVLRIGGPLPLRRPLPPLPRQLREEQPLSCAQELSTQEPRGTVTAAWPQPVWWWPSSFGTSTSQHHEMPREENTRQLNSALTKVQSHQISPSPAPLGPSQAAGSTLPPPCWMGASSRAGEGQCVKPARA